MTVYFRGVTARHMAGAPTGPVTTFDPTEILTDRGWYGDPHVQEHRRAARFVAR